MKLSGFESFQECSSSEKDTPYACGQRINLVALSSRAVCTSVSYCHKPILQPCN